MWESFCHTLQFFLNFLVTCLVEIFQNIFFKFNYCQLGPCEERKYSPEDDRDCDETTKIQCFGILFGRKCPILSAGDFY